MRGANLRSARREAGGGAASVRPDPIMRRGIDYEAAMDRRGRAVNPGDRVSVPMRRSSVRGIVEVSTRERSCPPGESDVSRCPWSLAVRADDGTLYRWVARGMLLRSRP